MKTVAIVGSHTRTRNEVPWDNQEIDIWVFNESASIGWPERVDGVFQMHDEPIWKNPKNRNDPKYPKWMRRPHNYPVWMLDKYKEVPASESFPLDDICDELLANLYKGEKRVRFFTSSVAYAIAQAINMGYEAIELYGVEMESETEYRYQGEGVHFWLGVAVGRGLTVRVAEKTRLFTEPLYGYEGGAYLGRKQLLERKELLQEHIEKVEKELDEINKKQGETMEQALSESDGKPGLADVNTTKEYFENLKAQERAVHDNGMAIGAMGEIVKYLEKCDEMDKETGSHMLARQEFEITAAGAKKAKDKIQEKVKVLGAEARIAWQNIEEGLKTNGDPEKLEKLSMEYHKAHQEYLKFVFELGRAKGVIAENITLLDKVDILVKAAGGMKAEDALLENMNQKLKGRIGNLKLREEIPA